MSADPIATIDACIAEQGVDTEASGWRTRLAGPPDCEFNPERTYLWQLETSHGPITVTLRPDAAPRHVASTIYLTRLGFYDGLSFHRVLPGFMAQGGCPRGDGFGGPGYQIPCECHQEDFRCHFRGSLSMAHGGRDTGGSQFFLTFVRTPHLDGKHTAFGRVVEGTEVLNNLQRINPDGDGPKAEPDKIVKAEVIRKRDHEYQPNKVN